ncbi:MAG: type II secretion system F family protein [Myxococcota bacterium]
MSMNERLRRAWLRHPVVAFARHRKLVTFYQQLLALVRAGIPLPTAFEQLTRYAPDALMRQGLSSVARDVRGGLTLGDALRKHAALFDDANVELLAFAEEAGRLEPVAGAIISHLERVQRQRWQAALGALWPMYLGGALVFVGPLLGVAQTAKSGTGIGAAYLSGLASSLFVAALALGAVLGTPFLVAALDLETRWDRLVRSVPLVSVPLRQLAASRLVLALGLASASGMEVVRALRLAARATVSPAVLAALPRAEARLRAGATLTEAVGELGVLDRTSLGTLSVAETTGTLDDALERMSRELEASSLRAVRLLVLVGTGLVAAVLLVKIVAGLLATILGPVKTLYDAAGSGSLDG